MMYRIVFYDREVKPQYAISKDGKIVWTTENLEVFLHKTVQHMVNWLGNGPRGARGGWKVLDARCTPPKRK